MTPRTRKSPFRRLVACDRCLMVWSAFSIILGIAHHLGWLP